MEIARPSKMEVGCGSAESIMVLYRVYYIVEGDELIILFAGSDKSDQRQAIEQAKKHLANYKKRK